MSLSMNQPIEKYFDIFSCWLVEFFEIRLFTEIVREIMRNEIN